MNHTMKWSSVAQSQNKTAVLPKYCFIISWLSSFDWFLLADMTRKRDFWSCLIFILILYLTDRIFDKSKHNSLTTVEIENVAFILRQIFFLYQDSGSYYSNTDQKYVLNSNIISFDEIIVRVKMIFQLQLIEKKINSNLIWSSIDFYFRSNLSQFVFKTITKRILQIFINFTRKWISSRISTNSTNQIYSQT